MQTRLLSTSVIAVSFLVFGAIIANAQTSSSGTVSPPSKAPTANPSSTTMPSGGASPSSGGPGATSAAPSGATPGASQQGQSSSPAGGDSTTTRHPTPSGTTSGSSSQTATPSTSSSTRAATAPAVNLTTEQKTEIRNTVINNRSAPRVASVNFNIAVGVAVPAAVHFAPLPATIVSIEPAWRGYEYFVHADQLIIVDPRTRRIVAILVV